MISCINTDISVDFEEPRDQTGLTELNAFTIIGGMKWYELRKQIFENSLLIEQFLQSLQREHKEILLNLMKAEFIASTNELENLNEPSLQKILSNESAGSAGGYTQQEYEIIIPEDEQYYGTSLVLKEKFALKKDMLEIHM